MVHACVLDLGVTWRTTTHAVLLVVKVHAESFLHSVASPFHSFVTKLNARLRVPNWPMDALSHAWIVAVTELQPRYLEACTAPPEWMHLFMPGR